MEQANTAQEIESLPTEENDKSKKKGFSKLDKVRGIIRTT